MINLNKMKKAVEKKAKALVLVPFDKEGNHVTYYSNYQVAEGRVCLIPNYTFKGQLKYIGYSRGQSALNIKWEDEYGHTYFSGMSLLDETLLGNNHVNRVGLIEGFFIEGEFTFAKRGTVVLLTENK